MCRLPAKPSNKIRGMPLNAALAALLALDGWSGSAAAEDSPWGGAIGFASDNAYRGLSVTGGRPAWFADVHRATGSDWVVGLSASAVHLPYEEKAAELVLYAQRGWQWTQDWSFTAAVMHHEFPWNQWRDKSRYDEVSFGLSWQNRIHLTVTGSPSTAGYYPTRSTDRGAAAWLELGFEQPLRGRLGANIGIGHAQYASADVPDYNYASAGLRYGSGNAYAYVSYIWSDLDGYFYRQNAIAGSRWVFSAVWTF